MPRQRADQQDDTNMFPQYLFLPFLPEAPHASHVLLADERYEPFGERLGCAGASRETIRDDQKPNVGLPKDGCLRG